MQSGYTTMQLVKWIVQSAQLCCCVSMVLLLGCQENRIATTEGQSAKIQRAINSDDVDSLVELTSQKLTVGSQKWESAKDGAGLRLGEN